MQGTPYLKELPQGRYWYARHRVGDKIVDRYIGPDGEELRQRIEHDRELIADEKALERSNALLVAQLRAARLPTADRQTGSVLAAMAKCGVFRLGGTLVGTHAFRLYSAELGFAFSGALAATQDIDIATFENLKLAIQDKPDPSLAETFRSLSLEPIPGLDPRGRSTRWRLKGGSALVDFLAPRMQSKKEIVKIEPLDIYAQTLPFLNFLIADPIPAVALYRSGILVQIPRPERYAIHKLIVSQRRSGPGLAKIPKDLAQADALIRVLADDRPGELGTAYELAFTSGKKWQEAMLAALKQRPAIGDILKRII